MSRPKTCEECEIENTEALAVLETGIKYGLLSDMHLARKILAKHGFYTNNWDILKAVAAAYRAGYIIGIRTERQKRRQKVAKINEI